MAAIDPIVSVEWLAEHQHDANLIILDTRPAEIYRQGHIPGAVNVDVTPAKLLSSEESAVARWHSAVERFFQQAGVAQDSTIIAYEDVSGTSAAYAVWLGDVAGLPGSAMLDGGFRAWITGGQPVERQANTPSPSNFSLTVHENVIATAQSINAALASDPASLQIVDSRLDQENLNGTIPGSRHLDWQTQLNPDGTFRPVAELRAAYTAQGIDLDADTPVATFCASGMRAANAYVVLKHIGVKQPQSYGPSWTEWGSQPTLPKEYPDPDLG